MKVYLKFVNPIKKNVLHINFFKETKQIIQAH